MKKAVRIIILFFLIMIIIFFWLLLFTPATTFSTNNRYLYVHDSADAKQQVMHQLQTKYIVRYVRAFSFFAGTMNVWEKLKPGKFEIHKGENLYAVLRTLGSNSQSPVKLIITKLRIKEDLAKLLGKNFSIDSSKAMNFLSNNDSLNFLSVDTNTLFTVIIPDTYFFNWNTPLKSILQKFKLEKEKFWNEERISKAKNLNLTPDQIYILASIVEEETNNNEEKDTIASVYINRLNKNMPLQADPTIKFALKDFALKRILLTHLAVTSPFNTYKNKGLPPGPICTPSTATIDAVLNAPKTDYLFFVAKSDFSGSHHFSSNFAEHELYAKQYQLALDAREAQNQKP